MSARSTFKQEHPLGTRVNPLPPDEFVLPTSNAPRNLGRHQRACRAHHGLDTACSTDTATGRSRAGAPNVAREPSVSARPVVVPAKRALPGWTLKRTTNIRVLVREIPGHATRFVHPRVIADVSRIRTHPSHIADKRQAEAQRIRTKYPERIPVRDPFLDFKPPGLESQFKARGRRHVACFSSRFGFVKLGSRNPSVSCA